MRDLLTTTNLRQLELIELLTYQDQDIYLDQIIKDYKESKRTIYRDIEAINKKYPFLKISIEEDTLSLIYENGAYIDLVYSYLMENEIAFNIIELTLWQEVVNVEDIADKLYISNSTVYRYIDMIKEKLKNFGDINFTTNPCKICGDESHIRAFSFHFLNERYGFNVWPFEDIDKDLIALLLKNIYSFLDIEWDYSFFYNSQVYLAMNIKLLKSGIIFDLEIDKSNLSFDPNALMDFLEDKQLDLLLEKELGFKLDEDKLIELLFPLSYIRIINNIDNVKNILKQDSEDPRRELLQSVCNFIDYGQLLLDIDDLDRDYLAFCLYNYLSLKHFIPSSMSLLKNDYNRFYKTVKNINPGLFSKLEEDLENLINCFFDDYSDNYKVFLMTFLMSNWKDLLPQIIGKHVVNKVLLVSSLGSSHALMYKQRLRHELSFYQPIDIYDRDYFDIEYINNSDYNFIISDLPLAGLSPDKTSFVIGSLPTKKLNNIIVNKLKENLTIKNMA